MSHGGSCEYLILAAASKQIQQQPLLLVGLLLRARSSSVAGRFSGLSWVSMIGRICPAHGTSAAIVFPSQSPNA
jgi:hypothetical protein